MKLFIVKSSVLLSALSAFAAQETTVVSTVASAEATASVETSTVKKTQVAKANATATVKPAGTTGSSIKSSATEVTEVEAVGYGDDHATAMSDACTQAVSQVCGAEVAKGILTCGNKSAQLGGSLFEGVLISYTVIEDVRSEDGSYTIKIKAKVKPPVTDIFSDKLALVLPESSSIKSTFRKGKLKPETAEAVATVVESCIKNSLADDARFVILDRNSALAQQERNFAGSARTSRLEKGKAGSMKAADFVLELNLVKGDEKMSVKEFKTAKRNKYTLAVDIELEIRLVDVATGGLLSCETIAISSSATSWREEKCVRSVSEAVEEKCSAVLPEKLNELFSPVQ